MKSNKGRLWVGVALGMVIMYPFTIYYKYQWSKELLQREGRLPSEVTPKPKPTPPSTPTTPAPPSKADPLPAPSDARSLAEAKSWGYQLQGVDPEFAAASPYDLLIVDRDDVAKADVTKMKTKPDGSKRFVVSYISVGEAEDYRSYWVPEWHSNKPGWMHAVNPEWVGNYPIDFWSKDWQAILFPYIDKIMAKGFDGIYMDRIDVYEEVGGEAKMVELVEAIAAHTYAKDPEFKIIQQNAEGLFVRYGARLVNAVDALAKEDLWYGVGGDGKKNSAGETSTALKGIRAAKKLKLPVFLVEYVRAPNQKAFVESSAKDEGLVTYYGPRNLAQLTIKDGAQVLSALSLPMPRQRRTRGKHWDD